MKWKLINIFLFVLALFNPIYSQQENSEAGIINVITHSAAFLGFCTECAEQAKNLIKYPNSAIENNITGTIDAILIIDENRRVSEVNLLNSLGYGCDKEVIRVSKLLTGFTAGNVKQASSKISYTISYKFKSERGKFSVDVITHDISLSEEQKRHNQRINYDQNFDKVIKESRNENIAYTSPFVITRYILSQINYELTSLERFADYENITLKFQDFDSKDTDILLLFHKNKLYVGNRYRIKGTLKFPLIPVGNDITVIVIKSINDHPHFYFETFETKQNRKFDVNHKRITYSELNKRIEELKIK